MDFSEPHTYRNKGMWFEGRLGREIDTFDTDVDALDSDIYPISDEEFRSRCEVVMDELRRVLAPAP
jgi:hypothetical protein